VKPQVARAVAETRGTPRYRDKTGRDRGGAATA
jgi:hypothetical protein